MKSALTAAALTIIAGAASAQTAEPLMMTPKNNAQMTALLTTGEFVSGDYMFVGIPDGIGAIELDANTIRLFVNHEFAQSANLPVGVDKKGEPIFQRFPLGSAYTVNEGAANILGGARISYFDLDKATRQITAGGLAYDTVIMRDGNPLTGDFDGFNRFCSGSNFGAAEGLVDEIYFAGEETGGGLEYALDTATGNLWELGYFGKAAWENVTILPTMGTDAENLSVFLVGDDRGGAPLLMYVGEKSTARGAGFLERNGLTGGRVYAWVPSDNLIGPIDFKGTGAVAQGSFVEIDIYDETGEDATNFDEFGFATQSYQDSQADAAGAFKFSRPEDIAYDPINPTAGRAVLASTGRNIAGVSDDLWGTLYQIDVDLNSVAAAYTSRGATQPTATITILEDSNDADNQDWGIRSPDNLDWADDGLVYLQEDRSINGFGATSGRDAQIWRFDPATKAKQIVAEMDQSAVPSTHVYPGGSLGTWESSGILDISSLMGTEPGTMFILDIQAHGTAWDGDLTTALEIVEGGQLILLETSEMARPVPACPGDINNSGTADLQDLNIVLANFGNSAATREMGDLDGDGTVDMTDLNILLKDFNISCN